MTTKKSTRLELLAAFFLSMVIGCGTSASVEPGPASVELSLGQFDQASTETAVQSGWDYDAMIDVIDKGAHPDATVDAQHRNMRVLQEAVLEAVAMKAFTGADDNRPAALLANAERLEDIARQSHSGALGCGVGSFLYTDYAGNERRVRCGLDPIHVFGQDIGAKTLSEFLEARVKANELKNGPMFGDRRFLLFTTLYAVADTEDAGFIDLVAKLLDDPIPQVRSGAEHALLCIGDGNPEKRTQILKLLVADKWAPSQYQSKHHDWVPAGG